MTTQEEELLVKTYDDLQVQAMMFDMSVDIETLTLVPKQVDNTPVWIKNWREKEHESDRKPEDYEGGSNER